MELGRDAAPEHSTAHGFPRAQTKTVDSSNHSLDVLFRARKSKHARPVCPIVDVLIRLNSQLTDDAKVVTRAPQSPPQIRVLRRRDGHQVARRSDEPRLDQIVDCQPVHGYQVPNSTAEVR